MPAPAVVDLTFVPAPTGYVLLVAGRVVGFVAPAPLNPRIWNAYAASTDRRRRRPVFVGQRTTRQLAVAAVLRHLDDNAPIPLHPVNPVGASR